LQQCAIHIAIIGSGNRTYGSIRLKDGSVVDIIDVFKKHQILCNNERNALLLKDTLTPRRLVRFYRYCTHIFIEKNNRPSYLWFKYSDHNEKYKNVCYPGAEHMVETKEEYEYIYNTYKNLDKIHGTSFCIRMQRVGIARGLITWQHEL